MFYTCVHRGRGRGVCPTPPVGKPGGFGRPPWMQTLWADPPRMQTPQADPHRQAPPRWADPPGCRLPLQGWVDSPELGRPPWMQIPHWGWADPPGCRPPGIEQTPPPDMVNRRAVRILLECILVLLYFQIQNSKQHPFQYVCLHNAKCTSIIFWQ